MDNILLLDQIESDGHINYNNIFINEVALRGFNVTLAITNDYYHKLSIKHKINHIIIPPKYLTRSNNKIKRLYNGHKYYKYVDNIIKDNNYKHIVLLCYDEMALLLSKIRNNVVLINHNNAKNINKIPFKYILRYLSYKYKHVVLHNYIKNKFIAIGINNVAVIRHGVWCKYEKNSETVNSVLHKLNININVEEYQHIIFSPSISGYDKNENNNLCNNHMFVKYLIDNNILYIAKVKDNTQYTNNIVYINTRLSDKEYRAMFAFASIILLNYSNKYINRISGILYECVANNKPCVMKKIEALYECRDMLSYDAYYSNIKELIKNINSILDAIQNNNCYYVEESMLAPNINEILY